MKLLNQKFSNGQSGPTICKAGSYCPEGSTSPIECPAGYFCPIQSSDKIPCPAGTYSDVLGLGSESQCKLGIEIKYVEYSEKFYMISSIFLIFI